MLSESRRWMLAPSAIFVRCDLDDPSLLGGLPPGPTSEATARELLAEWDIDGRDAVRLELSSLLANDGDDLPAIAWRLGRVAVVAGRGYLAGWLDEAAAWTACATAARELQSRFDSWEAFGRAFLDGRQAAGTENEENDAAMHFVFRALVLELAGPWSLPWATPLAD